MSYQVFARKYRPQNFDEVIGQAPSVTTLKNAISLARIHQAYLFCGARGVGKTSMARIFAKSLNCEKGPTANPCQTCTACVGITKGNSMDVLEIDGASNNGVDEVRELREQAKYLPTSGKYKIYIIDEVHMLSTSAFNALLKILEEPPPHILFIFATTEPHKIPVTILSRCQRFDFKRMSVPTLVGHLKNILAQEKVTLADESLFLIAHNAEGSVRDSLSLLDQVVSFCGTEAKPEQVREMLGLADRAILFDLLEGLVMLSVEQVLEKAAALYNKGFDLKIFAESLLEIIRHLVVLSEGGEKFVDLPTGEMERLKKVVGHAKTSHFILMFHLLARGVEEMARSDYPKLIFDTTLIKVMRASDWMPVSANQSAPTMDVVKNVSPVRATHASPLPNADTSPKLSPTPDFSWQSFVQKVVSEKPQVGSILEQARFVKKVGPVITLAFDANSLYADMLKDRLPIVVELGKKYCGFEPKFDWSTEASNLPTAAQIREDAEKKKADSLRAEALSHPTVMRAQELLGAKVKEVKELK